MGRSNARSSSSERIGLLNQALFLLVPKNRSFTKTLRYILLFKSVFFKEIIPFNKEERISITL